MSYNVFVYCGGKCGSSTLHNTFNNNGYKSIHVHSDLEYKTIYNTSNSVFNLIDLCCEKQNIVYFIDSYRTPIERKISSFFENIEKHLPNYEKLSLDEIICFFNNDLIYKLEEYHSINELFVNYNIPFWNKFDFDKKYNILKKDNKIFIKILFKDIKVWDKILEEIFGKKIEIQSVNLTQNKRIFHLYEEFKKKYKVPKKYIENILKNDLEFKVYNSLEEQAEYIQTWSHKSY